MVVQLPWLKPMIPREEATMSAALSPCTRAVCARGVSSSRAAGAYLARALLHGGEGADFELVRVLLQERRAVGLVHRVPAGVLALARFLARRLVANRAFILALRARQSLMAPSGTRGMTKKNALQAGDTSGERSSSSGIGHHESAAASSSCRGLAHWVDWHAPRWPSSGARMRARARSGSRRQAHEGATHRLREAALGRHEALGRRGPRQIVIKRGGERRHLAPRIAGGGGAEAGGKVGEGERGERERRGGGHGRTCACM